MSQTNEQLPKEFRCRECKETFNSHNALRHHMKEQFEADNGHLTCYVCGQYSRSVGGLNRHIVEFHATKQDLTCPGCDEKFTRVGGLIDHIEFSKCKVIDAGRLAAKREEKLQFARELQERHYGDFPDDESVVTTATASTRGDGDFSEYIGTRPSGLSALRPKAETTVRPGPIQFHARRLDFPQVPAPEYHAGRTKQADLLTGIENLAPKQQPGSAWNQKKNLFPTAPPAARPSPEALNRITAASNAKPASFQPHDPDGPSFDVSCYYQVVTKKYKCPHQYCTKSFPSANAFKTHLKSAAHARTRYQCPTCYRWFDSVTALTQHAESQGIRCNIRASDNYRVFLDQLTAGIADVEGVHDVDRTNRYIIPNDAAEAFFPGHKAQLQVRAAAASQHKMKAEQEEKQNYWQQNQPNW